MTGDDPDRNLIRRHSKADEAEIVTDKEQIANIEAANGLEQFDVAMRILESITPERPFRLRTSIIQNLHREALKGLSIYAGNWRPADVRIDGSEHQPVPSYLVPAEIEDLCDYVNDNWNTASAIHLSSYVMWRLNWIHPFSDGNGRTSRVVSYLVLSAKIGGRLVGTPTIPDLIVENRTPYFDALEFSDQAFKEGRIDVSAMEDLMEALLAKQFMGVIERAKA